MESMRIRTAAPGDEPLLLDLWAGAEAEPSVTDGLESIARLLERSPDSVLIAEIDGTPVGSLIATWDGWRGNMYRLAVLPSHRRMGIARALVDEGEQRLRAKGCLRVTALVMHEREWATSFWRAAGYLPDDRIVRYVRTLT